MTVTLSPEEQQEFEAIAREEVLTTEGWDRFRSWLHTKNPRRFTHGLAEDDEEMRRKRVEARAKGIEILGGM